MPIVKFPDDKKITYHYLGWQELGDLTQNLALSILKTDFNPDRIIALATGGLSMCRALRDYLGVKKLSSMQISFYEDIGKSRKTPIINQSIPINIDKETILIFDDINDTGETLKAAKAYLKLRGAKTIKTATLLQKSHTKTPSDFYEKQTDSWIIFPDEARETITLLEERWQKQSLLDQKINQRLKKIGFTQKQINTFSKLKK